MRWIWCVLACAALIGQAALAWAEALPMVSRASLLPQAAPLIAPSDPPMIRHSGPSLFVGRSETGLFAPPDPEELEKLRNYPAGDRIARLRTLIAQAEAGSKGYDAVQYGATIKPPADPTRLTIQQIYDWIDATPGQPHAIGRYQFIPPTLRRLVRQAGINPRQRFSPKVQDQLADILLADAGLRPFLAGEMDRVAFMNNLAKIWAGLPNDTGKSHYHGYAGNKATMTWAHFDAQMVHIFAR
ncbi:hypothetical protein [Tateyamaria sp. ANG-S1]|uniref:hypothetical protein n=1 Tax=Tateyamaria sp. ANG-S1 TaxID=1577905 RepID=UPI00057DE0EC|nr:hypothetical protein [Tateyamaria sp. ANG-S1]KIC46184.1 hypothetical protein RA29_19600 [Tateyamaria sp. ANG-S1]